MARRARPRRHAGRARLSRHLGPRHRLADRHRAGRGRWHRRLPRARGHERRRRRGVRRLAGRPVGTQGGTRRQGTAAGAARSTAGTLAGVTERHPARRLPAAARPAHLRPGRSRVALPASRAAHQRRGVRAAHPRRRHRRVRRRARRRPRRCAPARSATWPMRSTPSWSAAAPRGCSPSSSCRSPSCSPTWRPSASPPTPTPCSSLQAELGARGEGGRAGRPRSWSAASSTSVRRSSCRRSCSTSSGCPRPSGSRPATPPTPTRWPTSTCKTEHPVLELLLRHREVARLKTVVDGLLPLIDDHGRIHTTFNQTIAATGRLSSTDPNLQNIPVRTAEGRRIREAFTVGAGYESLMTADYSQIEMRIMAHLSRRRRADRGVHDRRGPAHLRRVPRLRPARREQIDRRAAPSGQGDVLRPGLRAVARSGCPSSSRSPRTRRAGRWTPTSPGSAACATTCARSSRTPGRPATPRRSWAGAATWPT